MLPAAPLDKQLEKNFLRFQLFDDSSFEALSHVALEEEAHSFHQRQQNPDEDQERERKMQMGQRKADKKMKDYLHKKEKKQREVRKDIRKHYRLKSQGIEEYDQYQDDVLNFKDSERESLLSYFHDS